MNKIKIGDILIKETPQGGLVIYQIGSTNFREINKPPSSDLDGTFWMILI